MVPTPAHKLEVEFFSPEEIDGVIFCKWLVQPDLLIYYALKNVSVASLVSVGSGAAEKVCGGKRTREGCNHGF